MFEEWILGCDNCQDVCPYNRRHDWDKGEFFSNLEEIAKDLVHEKLIDQTDDFLKREVIAKSDQHLDPDDTNVLRINARRQSAIPTEAWKSKNVCSGDFLIPESGQQGHPDMHLL